MNLCLIINYLPSSIYFLDIIELGHVVSSFLNTAIESSVKLDINLIYGIRHVFLILSLGMILGVFGALKSIARYLR